jgi:ABC-2 type transport system permease protein
MAFYPNYCGQALDEKSFEKNNCSRRLTVFDMRFILYIRYVAMHLKSQMQYKVSFFFTLAGQFLLSFTVLLGLYFMMDRFKTVGDFTLEQVLLCFAVVLMAFSLAECFARGFDLFPHMISNGELDRILVRPRGIIFQVLAGKIEFSRLGRLSQAILVFCYAIPSSGINWTFDKILTILLMVLCGPSLNTF